MCRQRETQRKGEREERKSPSMGSKFGEVSESVSECTVQAFECVSVCVCECSTHSIFYGVAYRHRRAKQTPKNLRKQEQASGADRVKRGTELKLGRSWQKLTAKSCGRSNNAAFEINMAKRGKRQQSAAHRNWPEFGNGFKGAPNQPGRRTRRRYPKGLGAARKPLLVN